MKKFTKQDSNRIDAKRKATEHALAGVKKGEPDNVTNMREHFTRKLYKNNKELYNQAVKGA